MKKQFSEKAFRDYLDQSNPKGITLENGDFFKDAKTYQKKSNTTFRSEYNDWIESNEREGIKTGCYDWLIKISLVFLVSQTMP